MFSTRAKLTAALRPHKKAFLLASIATPFNSMARNKAASDKGIAPFWKANPSMNKLVAIESPIKAVANFVALTKSTLPPTESEIKRSVDSNGNCQSGFLAKAPVGCSWLLMTARVRPARILEIASCWPAVKKSQPKIKSASPVGIRCARNLLTFSTIRICDVTEPFFCDMPVISNTEATLPSRCAAIPSKAPTVITPVPPIPFNKIL